MKTTLLLSLVLALTACGVGKKGDKKGRPTPPSTEAILTDFTPVIGTHVPYVQYTKHDNEGLLENVFFLESILDTTDWLTFSATYPGPGRLVGAMYQNGDDYIDLFLWFRLQLDPVTTAEYTLELTRSAERYLGFETVKIGGEETRIAVRFRSQ